MLVLISMLTSNSSVSLVILSYVLPCAYAYVASVNLACAADGVWWQVIKHRSQCRQVKIRLNISYILIRPYSFVFHRFLTFS